MAAFFLHGSGTSRLFWLDLETAGLDLETLRLDFETSGLDFETLGLERLLSGVADEREQCLRLIWLLDLGKNKNHILRKKSCMHDAAMLQLVCQLYGHIVMLLVLVHALALFFMFLCELFYHP